MTKEEWAELQRKVAAWERWQLEQTAKRAKDEAQRVAEDTRVSPDDLRKPTRRW